MSMHLSAIHEWPNAAWPLAMLAMLCLHGVGDEGPVHICFSPPASAACALGGDCSWPHLHTSLE